MGFVCVVLDFVICLLTCVCVCVIAQKFNLISNCFLSQRVIFPRTQVLATATSPGTTTTRAPSDADTSTTEGVAETPTISEQLKTV